ncbi:MAG: histidine phosphatase family protein [Streptosporangiales bacterium]|nr:histidine phosphatase family protein [Streptosporangiales bacterium]
MTGWRSPESVPTRLVLLRHGQTALSIERRFAGVGDVPLTEAGELQADAAGRRLAARGGIDAIVSSPLRRCVRTAEAAAGPLGLPVETLDDLKETDFGAWEGLSFAEVRRGWPDEMKAWLADPAVPPPGGESFDEVAVRVTRAREALLERHPRRTVLVVSHVTPIKLLLREALQAPPSALYRMHLDTACLCEIDWYADGPAVVRSLNDTAHLTEAGAGS